jgi:phosphopentomutase
MGEAPAARGRVTILVLDGLGIGALPDGPPEDAASHTLAHVHAASPLSIPHLSSLGLAELAGLDAHPVLTDPRGAFTSSGLGYLGADSYLGHSELMGGAPVPEPELMRDVGPAVADRLVRAGFVVESLLDGESPLLVNSCAVVADNIEAKPGLGINVTASLDALSFDEIVAIGELVREVVRVPRVIVVAGRGFGPDDLRRCLSSRADSQLGVDSPGLGVYDDEFRVRHLSLPVDGNRQLPAHVLAAGGEVVLIGKAADVISSPDARVIRPDDTERTLRATVDAAAGAAPGSLIVANVQETDLAGHEQDPHRFARVLEQVDGYLPEIRAAMRAQDILIVTADHGNDPCIGHSMHTREAVPVLVAGDRVQPRYLTPRDCLSDIAATVGDLLGLKDVDTAASFAKELF